MPMVACDKLGRLVALTAILAALTGMEGANGSSSSSAYETITEVINSSARFMFKTCGNAGRIGPTQYQCDAAYMSFHPGGQKVRVLNNSPLRGVQVWTVPKTRLYSITALGASGGTGLQNSEASRGGYANAKFNLTKGEKIYMLIGQMGQSACSYINKGNPQTKMICTKGIFNGEGEAQDVGGGGGGGGGTFVFKKNGDTLVPLIIAGGGGGKSGRLGGGPIRADGGISPPGSGRPGFTPDDGPGAGGGWEGEKEKDEEGSSLLHGAAGGQACKAALDLYQWQVYGGFGGGGGGCTAGGGGGGYSGGNVSLNNDPTHNGQGGASYISPLGLKPIIEPGSNNGHGEVEIAIVFPCACEFMCIYHNYEEKKFKCYCPANHVLAEDGLSCIDPTQMSLGTPLATVVGIIIGPIVVFAIGCIICVIVIRSRRRPPTELDSLTSADYQLNRLRTHLGGPGIMSEYNPNYDFGGTKCTLQDLREIPRGCLTLVRGLGQGAFGEVYQGNLGNELREPRELPVAVKTLPALSTDQAEMDFLMEALIMSKFNHPNIVRFIGVCFEKHPRFIILELLEGGDLKTFLRDSRPKPDLPSRVTIVDLVHLSIDVAKGCQYLEENHFIHRADYYRKGGKAMLPVKWMPPEAFLDGIFTSKTDVWAFGILLWEVFSLGYMPYPGRGNQEVMQLVTAGGRLDPPESCPGPIYHIMNMCWHGIPERRPTFTTVIECLQRCLQDPEVIHSPLPVIRRPPSVERDATLMRPRDADRMVLTVENPDKYLEPDSPSSIDQLIEPQSPPFQHQEQQHHNEQQPSEQSNSHPLSLQMRPNLRASAESIDALLRQEDQAAAIEGAQHASIDANDIKLDTARPFPSDQFAYQRVFDYDVGSDDHLEEHLDKVLEGGKSVEGGTNGSQVKGEDIQDDIDSTADSGKSSVENIYDSDSDAHASTDSTPSHHRRKSDVKLPYVASVTLPPVSAVPGGKNCMVETNDPNYVNIDVAASNPKGASDAPAPQEAYSTSSRGGRGNASSTTPAVRTVAQEEEKPVATDFLNQNISEKHGDAGGGRDSGDSGVVIDLKETTAPTNKPDSTWI